MLGMGQSIVALLSRANTWVANQFYASGVRVGFNTLTPLATVDFENTGEGAAVSTTVSEYSLRARAASGATGNIGRFIAVTEGSLVTAAINPFDDGSAARQGWDFYTGLNTGLIRSLRLDSSGNALAYGYLTLGNTAAAAGYNTTGSITAPLAATARFKNTGRFLINFNGTGTVAIRDNTNVASITDAGTGEYQVNLSVALPSTNATIIASGCRGSGVKNTTDFISHQIISTTRVDVFLVTVSGYPIDWEFINVFGTGG